jgi:LysM repeat protein
MLVVILSLAPATAFAAPAEHHGYCHPVRFGETVFSIARYHGVNPWALAQANGLANPNYIRAGVDCLVIPWGGYHGGSCWYGRGHWVQPGENLYRIAMRYGVSAWSLAAANGIYDLNYIQAGSCLNVPPW